MDDSCKASVVLFLFANQLSLRMLSSRVLLQVLSQESQTWDSSSTDDTLTK